MVTVKITCEGWFLFCPIWMADYNGEPMPIPKMGRFGDFIFTLAMFVGECVNILVSLSNPNAVGYAFKLRDLDEPFDMELPDFEPEGDA